MGADIHQTCSALKRLVIGATLVAMMWIVLDSRDTGIVAGSGDGIVATPIAGAEVASEAPVPAGVAGTVGPATLSIAVTGELLPHPSIVEWAARYGAERGREYDFGALFADIAPLVSAADLAICHVEVPVAPPGKPLSGYPLFAIPAAIADGIHDTGWDRCSTASNHSNDQGTAGIVATLDALDAAGVAHSGTARSLEEAMSPGITDIGGAEVAHLSYTWGYNADPPAEFWMANVIDADRIFNDAALARAAGADLVVVSLHWGDQYDTVGNDDQRALAARLLASSDIDLIVGTGPHVLQPIERYGDEYALLSVGNLIANQGSERPYTYDGVVATITFDRRADGRYVAEPPVIEPTWYDRDVGRVRLAPATSAERTRSIIGD